ncbi:MAG: cation:proton antiporter [Acidobacteriia bacterium]|jgi:CPA2 family monovalent cation:H+ antiporter-2|nr:cation:proton antiporter [Terriglobia bacterium]
MEQSGILRDLIVLYGMAMAIAFLLRKAKQPTMIGYLITGVLAGPYALRLISDTQAVELLAQVGVALLLFTIGLELSLKKLARMQQLALAAGSVQLIAAVLATAGLLLWLGFAIREAFFWGFLVAISSTAVVLKVLHDRGELDTLHGRAVLGIQLFQDLCVVPMMALLPTLAAPEGGQALRVLAALGKSLLIVSAILLLARYLFPPLLRAIVLVRSRELFVIASIFFALGTAWGATQFGLSLALGAFLAGIVLSESEYGHQIMAEILPFRDGLTSLFFISVGMLIDLRFVVAHAGVLAAVVAAILLGKLLLGGASIAVLGFPLRMAALVSLALAQVGEFSFVLLSEGFRLGLISTERYQIFLAAAVLTMMVTPGFIAAGPRVAQWLGQKGERRRSRLAPDETTERLRDHVILCGYGLNGRRMARLLREYHLPYVIIEMNPRLVRQARAEGEPIYFGDASNPQILKAAGADHARAIVFAISDPSVLARAISHARLRNPDLHIIARIKRIEDARELRQAGATDVIAEELEAWMEIAVRVLRLYGMPREAVAELIGRLRAEDYDMVRILPIPGQPLRHLAHLLPEVDIELFIVLPGSPLVGTELRQLELRQRTGVNVLAVIRDPQVVHNPPGEFRIQEGDQLILIGSRRQLQAAYDILSAPPAGTVAERTDAARGE